MQIHRDSYPLFLQQLNNKHIFINSNVLTNQKF